jgi:hypothetical protein
MMMKDIYVIVTERDQGPDYPANPIVWEQDIIGDSASLPKIRARAARIGDRFGKVRIAKLQFIDEEHNEQ